MNKPSVFSLQFENVPPELAREHRWVLWRYVWSDRDGKVGRWTKMPCQATGYAAKPNDASTWTTFDDALRASRSRVFDGIGFCLGDGWAGIDLDHCRTDHGVIGAALAAVRRIDCYLEVSPSGTGFKAIGRSERIGGQVDFGVRPASFTTWQGPRFFTITGRTHGSGRATTDITSLLSEWFVDRAPLGRFGPIPSFLSLGDTRGTERIERFTDDEVVRRILASPQADKFLRLVRADLSDYGGDHSRADQALVSILAYWCQGDLDQVDRLFRDSGLMRPKWNTASYRRATLSKAVSR
jgi:putative DNA primase/helicase